jgi:hypothetical protein
MITLVYVQLVWQFFACLDISILLFDLDYIHELKQFHLHFSTTSNYKPFKGQKTKQY